MYTSPITDRNDAQLASRALHELTNAETALVAGGGYVFDPYHHAPITKPTIPVGRNPNPDSSIIDEYNQRVLDHGDGLAD
jgi:hypothetical protein